MTAEVRKDGKTTFAYDNIAAIKNRGGAYEIEFWTKPSVYVFKDAADSVIVTLGGKTESRTLITEYELL